MQQWLLNFCILITCLLGAGYMYFLRVLIGLLGKVCLL